MIKIYLGKLGSGKTASCVREIIKDVTGRKTYSNIKLKGFSDRYVNIKPEYVIKKISEEKNKIKLELNKEYWMRQKKPLNIVWDEIHLTANSRASASRVNMVISKFIAMGRRITGFDEKGYGFLIFVAQNERTIDVNIRELTNEVYYHIGHWILSCKSCNSNIALNSEMPYYNRCPLCSSFDIFRHSFYVERLMFDKWVKFYEWSLNKRNKTYFGRVIISDIKDYFKFYDTMQMEDIWESYVT